MNNQIKLKDEFLRNKRVLVLGGSSGIGLATARAAAANGAQVIIVSSNQGRINEALGQIAGQHEGYVADLNDEDAIKQVIGKIGFIDHLIYTAGENIQLNNLTNTDITSARQYFNIRYWGAVATVKYAAVNIRAGGSVVLTSGIAAARPQAGWGMGASICAAMEGFTRSMAVELAPIRINIVSPGFVRTPLWGGIPEAEREAMFKTAGDALPVKRIGVADDIAHTYLYLLKQGFCTGQVLTVDGGAVLV